MSVLDLAKCPAQAGFDWLDRFLAAEQADGWLSACVDSGRYLAPCAELVEPLAALLRRLAAGRPVLEVCAGHGELAAALSARGLSMRAVDAAPPAGAAVERATVQDALRRYRPAVVLGVFVPIDAGVDPTVLACDDVAHYVVLGPRIGGLLGSWSLWNSPGWHAEPLQHIGRHMLTRHDVWIGPGRREILRHGEAWHFRRASCSSQSPT
jgi:hypothetical protein